jgi:anti-sigma-K factor RskA
VVEIRAGGTVRLRPVSDTGVIPPGRSLQFWTKLKGAAGPTSLGLVKAGQPLELPVSRLPGVGAQQLFEITLEPEGGSTIGRPTGPILYVGRTVSL